MAARFPPVPDLERHLLGLLAQVPEGRVTTCGALASALGNRIAARWVGHFALHHDHSDQCRCHRIVRVGGELGGYIAGSLSAKAQRLAEEGVALDGGRIDLAQFGFEGFVGERPLVDLRRIQEKIQTRIVLRGRRRMPRLIAGVDVAYPNAGEGVAAYALVETETASLVWSTTIRRPVRFPYIGTYLSFREIPILLELLDKVRAVGQIADMLLVDGSGILHHRHAGIASHLGVIEAMPTVGVTKKLLCGQVDIRDMLPGQSRPVVHEGQAIGVALRPTAGSRRPIFVSPGHRVDLAFCERLVRRLLTGRRLPEPLYWADRLSRE
jgi:deoxyribonuclease V